MTYDYASWDDENYPESTVVLSVAERSGLGGDEALELAVHVQGVPGVDASLAFTFSPEDEEKFLDLLLRRAGRSRT